MSPGSTATLGVRFCEPTEKATGAATIAKTAQARVPVLPEPPRKFRHNLLWGRLKNRIRDLCFQPRKQPLGVSPIDGLPIVFRKAGVLDEPFVGQFVIPDGRIAAVQDL